MRRWLAVFAIWLLVLGLPAAWMLGHLGQPWQNLFTHPGAFQENYQQVLKLIIFAIYLSVCSTFVPLPTSWLVAAIATREVALAGSLVSTVFLVAAAGALGSMMANLNDYHLFTLMLRSRKVAAVRDTRLVRYGSGWFAQAPFTWVLLFNIVPIPVDVIRMLAAATRYPLKSFALANFLGRFVRYGLLAALAYAANISALAAAAIMLGVAALLAAGRGVLSLVRRPEPEQQPAE